MAPHTDALGDLDAHVRRTDPDRWIAARFVGAAALRQELLALYALYGEWARLGGAVTQPLIGEMRLAWWRDSLAEVAAGHARPGHPLLEAMAPMLGEGRLPLALLEPILDARLADFETVPFADEAAVERYLDGTAGALMKAAAVLLDPTAATVSFEAAGRAWGWARGGGKTPATWDRLSPEDLAGRVRAKVEAALAAARGELAALPVSSFPAVAYVTLARAYGRGRSPSDIGKRVRLLLATARGRI